MPAACRPASLQVVPMRYFAPTLALLSAASVAAQAEPPSYLYSIKAATPGQRLLLQQHFDVLGTCCGAAARNDGPLEVVVQQAELPLFLALVPRAELVDINRPFRDIALQRAPTIGTDLPDLAYYEVAEIEAAIDAEVAAHPGLAQKINLSALPGGVLTHNGRAIFALKVSDNAASDEDEPAILIAAQHHARELNSPVMVIEAMRRVLGAYATNPALQNVVNSYELYFVPMVNPDGVDYVWNTNANWRKNRRANGGTSYGVDNNRNYSFLWGLCGSSTVTTSETYRGPSAASEPETLVMRNLVARLRPEIYLDFHSYGQEVLRNYATCATVNPTIFTFLEHYVDDLAAPMTYNKRDPSGSGEAPHDHWASGGTLSYLIEVGTTFQPAYSTTASEEVRVWPGVNRVLTTWRPARRGHVRSSAGSAPLSATITYTPNLFSHGEVTKSRARDGRYGLWLPIGSWNVTFAATGHASKTVPVTVTGYDVPVVLDVVLEPTAVTPVLAAQGTRRIGTQVALTYTHQGAAGSQALFGWSLGTTPGIQLGGQRVVPLNGDFLFEAAWLGNPVLAPSWGTLDASGQAHCTLSIPNTPMLVGLTSYIAGITFDSTYHYGIRAWSAPLAITPLP